MYKVWGSSKVLRKMLRLLNFLLLLENDLKSHDLFFKVDPKTFLIFSVFFHEVQQIIYSSSNSYPP
jgi:hypothetical protein